MKPKQYRQGDVLIERVDRIDKIQPAPRERGKVVLAHGEVTGHAHAIAEPDVVMTPYRTVQAQGAPIQVAYLDVDGARAGVKHEEHGTIELERGEHCVLRQREYSPEAIRNVAD